MTIAIICEYNPFHNGHAAQIARLRTAYPDCRIVCIMSGCFTQRGEPAILSPYARAKMAVLGGADLVLELPQPWASGSAEYFAAGGVAIAHGLGIVDALAFGCETDDLSAPMRVAEQLDSPEFRADLTADHDPAEGAAARIARLWQMRYGDDGGMLSRPNNLLGVEYCRALRRLGSTVAPLPMKREGSAYDNPNLCAHHPSATAVRRALAAGAEPLALSDYLPAGTVAVLEEAIAAERGPVSPDALDRTILAHYRLADPDKLSACASMRGGLAHRLCDAARTACSLEEMQNLAATKVYTNARIRRAILQGMLEVTEADLSTSPGGTLVLAANGTGRTMLREVRQMGGLPLIPKPADLAAVVSERESLLRRRAESLWTLALPHPMPSGAMVLERPYLDEA